MNSLSGVETAGIWDAFYEGRVVTGRIFTDISLYTQNQLNGSV